jgi:hypothetical protein
MYYKKELRKRILLINLIGNIMQMTVTCVMGIIGLSFFISKYSLDLDYLKLVIGIALVILVLIFFSYVLLKSKLTIRGFSLEKLKGFFQEFNREKLGWGIMLSLFRYIIFSFQFYFLLQLFNVDITYFNAMAIIASMYILASVMPSIFIFDVLIKGSVALYLFTFIGVNELTILSIITIMWILNFVIPSIVGSFYVLNFKFPKENHPL